MRKLGFDVNDADVDRLIAKFSGRRGRVSYRKFLGVIAPEHEMEVEATAEKLHRLLQKVDLEDAFEHFERNRDGIISRKAFNRGLRALKFDLSESEMHSLLERFDANDDGYVSFEEFRSFARGRAPLSTKKRRRRVHLKTLTAMWIGYESTWIHANSTRTSSTSMPRTMRCASNTSF